MNPIYYLLFILVIGLILYGIYYYYKNSNVKSLVAYVPLLTGIAALGGLAFAYYRQYSKSIMNHVQYDRDHLDPYIQKINKVMLKNFPYSQYISKNYIPKSEEEMWKITWVLEQIFHCLQSAYMTVQHRGSTFFNPLTKKYDQRILEWYKSFVQRWMNYPICQQHWQNYHHLYLEDFQNYIQSVVKDSTIVSNKINTMPDLQLPPHNITLVANS